MLSLQEIENLSKTNLFSNLPGKKILITGASGFIGGYLLESIVTILQLQGLEPAEITALTRNGKLNCSQETRNSTNIVSFGDQIDCFKSNDQFDIVIHAASPASPKFFSSISEMNAINSNFIKNIVLNQKNLEIFIYFSAGEVYGSNPPLGVRETYDTRVESSLKRSSYPIAKIAGEKMLTDISSEYKFIPKIIRLFHTFGPGVRKNDGRSISDFFWQVGQGTPPELYSDGLARRSFLFANDMVTAMLHILNSSDKEIIYNVGSEHIITIRDFATLIAKNSNLPLDYTITKNNPNHEESPIQEILPNLDKLKRLGWKESFSLEKGVEITLLWVKSQLTQDLGRRKY